MFEPRSLPMVGLVVELTDATNCHMLGRLTQQLSEAQIEPTWIIALRETQLLARIGRGSMPSSWGLRCSSGDLPRLGDLFADQGPGAAGADVVACDTALARANLLNLHTVGIRSILGGDLDAAVAQRTPEGVWQFGESLSTAAADRVFTKSVVKRLERHRGGMAVVRIDLSATQTTRGRRRTERLVDYLVEQHGRQLGVVSLTAAAASLEARTVPRPQRSILRAA